MFIIATWGKYEGNTQRINLLLSPLKFITLHTFLYKVSCQDLFILYNLFLNTYKSSDMLNKNSLAVKKLRG